MKKTEQENEELKEKLETLEESSVSENILRFEYSFKLHCLLRCSPKCSWTPLISTFEFAVISNSKPLPLDKPSSPLLSALSNFLRFEIFFVYPVSFK